MTAPGWLRSPAGVRWLGFAGSVCAATDAVLFGAPVWIRRGVSVMSILRGPNGVLIMLLWIAGLAALCAAWWYGRRLSVSRRWILVTAALWIAPMLLVPPLASRDMYAYACQGSLFDAGFNPSVVGVSAQPCPWLESVSVVWRDTPTPYGPLWIILTGLAASWGSQAVALGIFRAYAVLAVLMLAVVVPALARRTGASQERALWLVLCCPLVPVHFVGGGHNDALTIALLLGGLTLIVGRRPLGSLVAGGALVGAAIAVKTTVGVVLPFAALLAAGGLCLSRPGMLRFLRRGGAVVGGAAAMLVALSAGSGLGFGWAVALSGAGESRSWTSPPTAVGIAVNAVGKVLGVRIDVVPAVRTVALILLLIVLVAIWWRFRRGDALHGAALACLSVIFFAPITQPWYLFWALALFAAGAVRARWLEITVVASMFLILPNGDGAWKPLQVPFAFLVTGLAGWVVWRSWRWWREPVPVEGAPA
ncbi:polyprenol phosphomannose-dependent alpha 1,6 mannosyltransferase MptB [Actinoplanes sp. NPDC051346]|uniref:polyprenol phosphomannose-dependent alpha 1,6 mannosyltransferase MptB n=1 Tax=Actinoplanes sp. NPDC051346 TaxID=3155048 RepID=UPI0034293D3F